MLTPPAFPPDHFDPALGHPVPPETALLTAQHLFSILPPLWSLNDGPPAPLLAPTLTLHPTGWLCLTLTGPVTLSAWMDSPYEDWELYPSALALRPADPPGRITRRLDRIEFSTSAWPTLFPQSRAGWVILTAAG